MKDNVVAIIGDLTEAEWRDKMADVAENVLVTVNTQLTEGGGEKLNQTLTVSEGYLNICSSCLYGYTHSVSLLHRIP